MPARSPLLPRLAPVLAISAFGATIALGGGAFALAGDTYAGVFLPFAVIGLILAWRRPRQPDRLDALSGELVGVVRETVQPAHAALWLRRTR